MALTTGKKMFILTENEVCYNLEHVFPCSPGGSLKMYIPKLMPKIGFGEPKTLPVTFAGDRVFCNDDACKPAASQTFNTKNWIEPTLMYNVDDWEHIIDGLGKVPKKTKFMCSFANGSIDKIRFSTNQW